MKFYFLILLTLYLVSPTFAQTDDFRILKGIDYVYKLEFDSAYNLFNSIISENPKDPTGYFFQAMVEWWKIYLNKEDRSNDDNYLAKVDKCIKICEQRLDENENDYWTTFLLGGVIGYRGFMNVMRDNWLKAIDDGKQGLNLIQKSYELNPANKDAVLGLAIYNYAVDYVVERYPFLKAVLFFFPKGNKELGLSQLKDCAANGKYSKIEAISALTYIHLNYEKNYSEAEKYSKQLYELYPNNPVFLRFLGKAFTGMGNFIDAKKLYYLMLAKADSNHLGFNNNYIKREIYYYLGLCQSKLGSMDEAIKYYNFSIDICKSLDKQGEESAFYVFSVLGIGIVYDQLGDKSEAIKYYDMVLSMKDIENSRENALRLKTNISK